MLDYSNFTTQSESMTTAQELVRLQIIRGNILNALECAIDTAGLVSYTYTDADGTQSTTRRNPKDLMELLKEIDRQIEILERRMQRGGIMTFGTDRYNSA